MKHLRLEGKTALITGASNGIGRSIALAFAREGAQVFITYNKDLDAALTLTREIEKLGQKIGIMQLDVQNPNAAQALFESSIKFLGKIDILVNNVGVATRTPFLETTYDEYDSVFSANIRFPFFLSQMVGKSMIKNEVEGSIINISSISAFKAISQMAHYQCSKAALSMLTKSISYELAAHRIRVNTISPGLTATNANRNQWEENPDLWRFRGKDIPLRRTGIPEDLAGAAVFLASQESAWMTGADLVIDGGESAI